MAWKSFVIDFPYRDQCLVELLIEGKQFFPDLLEKISSSKTSIYIEMYLVTSGEITSRVIDHLVEAAQRGVKILLIFDDVGCRGLSLSDKQRLEKSENVELRIYNPLQVKKGWANIFRDHRKLIIIDNTFAYIGGAGIADEFYLGAKSAGGQKRSPPWLDIMVKVTGPLVSDMTKLFSLTWRKVSQTPVNVPAVEITEPEFCWQGAPRYRLLASRGLRRSRIKKSMLNHINSSVHRVWLVNPYFYPSRSIRRALQRAAKKGVDVRLILPSSNTDHPMLRYAGQHFYGALLKSGVKVYEYRTTFVHAKALLCDAWASVGSYNLDLWSLRWNLEANIETNDANFISGLQAMLATCQEQSLEFTFHAWIKRSKFSIVREYLAWAAGRLFLMLDAPRETKNYLDRDDS